MNLFMETINGYGRFDIAIFPKKERTAGATLEFKVAEKEELQARAREALAQIEEKDYLAVRHCLLGEEVPDSGGLRVQFFLIPIDTPFPLC